jgi:hypothetical protein
MVLQMTLLQFSTTFSWFWDVIDVNGLVCGSIMESLQHSDLVRRPIP